MRRISQAARGPHGSHDVDGADKYVNVAPSGGARDLGKFDVREPPP